MMKVLFVHNFYRHPGGEDAVFRAESSLLESRGHRVLRYTAHNSSIEFLDRVTLFRKTLCNRFVCRELSRLVREEKPDIVHFHNTFPLISPAAYATVRREGAAVVQTLHNYRLLCPEARFFRNGRPCELCIFRRFAWPSVRYACYQGSRAGSAVVSAMIAYHRMLGTWRRTVDAYITLTAFSRRKFMEAGFDPAKLFAKQNFLEQDPGEGKGKEGYALFVGRLSPEKGLDLLLDAWEIMKKGQNLYVVGHGPLEPAVARRCAALKGVEFMGRRSHEEVIALMKGARMLVLPSLWFEGLPMTLIEAFATGLPVVASRLGSLEELVSHGITGLHFTPGDPIDLAEKMAYAFKQSRHMNSMRVAARMEFTTRYGAGLNYSTLIDIYEKARAIRASAG